MQNNLKVSKANMKFWVKLVFCCNFVSFYCLILLKTGLKVMKKFDTKPNLEIVAVFKVPTLDKII